MQSTQVLCAIDEILVRGEAEGTNVVSTCQSHHSHLGCLNSSRARIQTMEEFVAAMRHCFETLRTLIADSESNQDATIISEARAKVASFIHSGVRAHSNAFLEMPLTRCSGPNYPAEEQFRDRLEAEADIIFYRATRIGKAAGPTM
jgi:hypothetical protein